MIAKLYYDWTKQNTIGNFLRFRPYLENGLEEIYLRGIQVLKGRLIIQVTRTNAFPMCYNHSQIKPLVRITALRPYWKDKTEQSLS